jgi:hypothetical protein
MPHYIGKYLKIFDYLVLYNLDVLKLLTVTISFYTCENNTKKENKSLR